MVNTRSAEKSSGAELSAGAWWRDTLKVGITAPKAVKTTRSGNEFSGESASGTTIIEDTAYNKGDA